MIENSPLGLSNLSVLEYLIGFVYVLLLSFFIRYIYNTYSNTFSSKNIFSNLLPLFSVAIYVIVVVIKSSLALSLGLVGALSIIRLRTAIKEPEQIIILLVMTSISIATAAGTYFLPVILSLFVWIHYFFQNKQYVKNDFQLEDQLVITSSLISNSVIENIISKINNNGSNVSIQSIKKTQASSILILKVSDFSLESLDIIEKIFSDEKIKNVEIEVFSNID
ncbi:DUF4956 domain-containing protein [Candidatus Marinimicrobia bacterium]|nr:DUF4956 domain-containing protein [Candidatus Neomarinimicrobiota bacterium]